MLYVDDTVTACTPAMLENLLDELPAWRRAVVDRIGPEQSKLLSTMAFILLQRALREEFGIAEVPEFAFGERGKPYLPDFPDIHFNLSHCPQAVACAVARHPVGVDVERIRPYNDRLARYIASDAEYRAITSHPSPAEAFAALWTRKEACCKLSGQGIPGQEKLRSLLTPPPCRLTTAIHPTYAITLAQP